MRTSWVGIVSSCLLIASCSNDSAPPAAEAGPGAGAAVEQSDGAGAERTPYPAGAIAAQTSAPGAGATARTPVPIEAGAVTLGPDNTRIEFVGTHVGSDPNPRTGGFERFTGKVQLDPVTKQLQAVSVEIETASVWTEVGGRLTNHLKSPDFFEVREHPTIQFDTASITASAGSAAQYDLTGKLTLHGVTREISFPATVNVTDDGLTLSATFTIDRTDYGMNRLAQRVVSDVSLTVVIGEKTQPRQIQGRGGRGGGRGRGGRSGEGRGRRQG